jgi:AraC-like DNA-binding protein
MSYLLLACAVSILFFASVQLTERSKQAMHYCMAISCFAAGCVYLSLLAVTNGQIVKLPALANSDVAALLVLAPAFYLTSLSILHEGRRPVRRYSVYFVAPVLLAIGSVIYNALTAPVLMSTTGAVPGHFSNTARTVLTVCAGLSITAAIVLDLFAARRLHRTGRVQNKAGFRHQVIFLFCYLAAALVWLVSCAFRDDRLYTIATLPACPIVLAYALSRTAVFYFPQGQPPRRGKPEWNSSAPELTARLSTLMETAAPFRDDALTLQRLAGMLGEEPRRLSYHLNFSLSKSFRGYINEWRLAAVCRDLLADPNRSILEVAFESGFNSKSSFNSLFFKKYGRTPREFRHENPDR